MEYLFFFSRDNSRKFNFKNLVEMFDESENNNSVHLINEEDNYLMTLYNDYKVLIDESSSYFLKSKEKFNYKSILNYYYDYKDDFKFLRERKYFYLIRK